MLPKSYGVQNGCWNCLHCYDTDLDYNVCTLCRLPAPAIYDWENWINWVTDHKVDKAGRCINWTPKEEEDNEKEI